MSTKRREKGWANLSGSIESHYMNNGLDSLCGLHGKPTFIVGKDKGNPPCKRCKEILKVPEDERATCQVCLKTFDERDINMVDHDLDVCVGCEPGYLKDKFCL